MMQAKEVEALITAMVDPLLQDTGLTLVDVEYVREKDWYLRIFSISLVELKLMTARW